MLKTTMKLMSVVFYLLLIAGCGGSEGGSDISAEAQDSTVNGIDDVEQEQVETTSLSMDFLIADEDFTFANKNQVDVFVELTDYDEQRGYVSLYSVYQQLDSGLYYPDSTSRVISGALVNGLFEQSFFSVNNQQQYLVEVWFYDGQEAIQKVLTLNKDQLVFKPNEDA
jgi:hypothetical protein